VNTARHLAAAFVVLCAIAGPFVGWLMGFGQGAEYQAKATRDEYERFVAAEARKAKGK
jgi:hypothetical protein